MASLKDAGFTKSEILEAKFPANLLLDADYTLHELIQAGYDKFHLMECGVSESEILTILPSEDRTQMPIDVAWKKPQKSVESQTISKENLLKQVSETGLSRGGAPLVLPAQSEERYYVHHFLKECVSFEDI